MAKWSTTFTYLTTLPPTFEATDTDHLIDQVQACADAKPRDPSIGKLEVDDYSDEVHFWFRRNGQKRRFANLQYEG